MKYPIGIQSFSDIIENGYVYVDKTDLVYKLVTEGKIYFLSRPRRFGKSLLVSTLESYFLGRKELFKGLKIDALEKEWNTYPVFHLDFNLGKFTDPTCLETVIREFIEENEIKYNIKNASEVTGKRFAEILKQAHAHTGRKAVVLIDEYDKPLLDVMETNLKSLDGASSLEESNRQLLKEFYSVFKSADAHLQFVLLTGVTKFSQVSVFSGFNQPEDISMSADFQSLCGITLDEIEQNFSESLNLLAHDQNLTLDETKAWLKRKYDGYHFSKKMLDIYNPFSLLNCFKQKDFSDFWFSTATPSYLEHLMVDNDVNIDEIINHEYSASEFVDYKANKQMPLPMLYQSGYLTIKGFRERRQRYKLDFPNDEVRNGMISLLSSNYFEENKSGRKGWIDRVCDALDSADLATFEKELTALLAGISYRFREKNDMEYERHFQYSFYLVMLMIGAFNVVAEREMSDGRIDCVIECPDYIYIFEFKRNGCAAQALKQIDDKGYAKPYVADPRPLYKVGINFSTATGTIEEMLWEKEQEQDVLIL